MCLCVLQLNRLQFVFDVTNATLDFGRAILVQHLQDRVERAANLIEFTDVLLVGQLLDEYQHNAERLLLQAGVRNA